MHYMPALFLDVFIQSIFHQIYLLRMAWQYKLVRLSTPCKHFTRQWKILGERLTQLISGWYCPPLCGLL